MIGKPSANRRSFDCEQFFIDILGKWAFWSYSRDKCRICLAYRFGVYHVGAGGFACPAEQAASRLWSAPGAPFSPARFESTLVSPYQNKTRIFRCGSYFGGGGWIRTTVGIASRFTVCPLWPLGNTPIFGWSRNALPTKVELATGIEPATCALQVRCSTFEPRQQEIQLCHNSKGSRVCQQ